MPLLLAAVALDAEPRQQADSLIYSSYLGSAFPKAVAVDAEGAAYIIGGTRSPDLPTAPDSFQPKFGGGTCFALGIGAGNSRTFPCDDVFVAKMNPEGTALEYATYIGGRGRDVGIDIAVDESGIAYVLAESQGGMPTAESVFQPDARGVNAWVGKLDALGQLVWGTYLGGGLERPRGIAIDTHSCPN